MTTYPRARSGVHPILPAALTFVWALPIASCGAESHTVNTVEARYSQALSAFEQGDLHETVALTADIEKAVSEFKPALVLRAKALSLLGETSEALRIFSRVYEADSAQSEAARWLVRLYIAENDPETALEIVDRLLDRDPSDPRSLHLKGLAHEAQGNLAAALAEFDAAASVVAGLGRIHLDIARLYHRFGLESHAREELARVNEVSGHGGVLRRAANALSERMDSVYENGRTEDSRTEEN